MISNNQERRPLNTRAALDSAELTPQELQLASGLLETLGIAADFLGASTVLGDDRLPASNDSMLTLGIAWALRAKREGSGVITPDQIVKKYQISANADLDRRIEQEKRNNALQEEADSEWSKEFLLELGSKIEGVFPVDSDEKVIIEPDLLSYCMYRAFAHGLGFDGVIPKEQAKLIEFFTNSHIRGTEYAYNEEGTLEMLDWEDSPLGDLTEDEVLSSTYQLSLKDFRDCAVIWRDRGLGLASKDVRDRWFLSDVEAARRP